LVIDFALEIGLKESGEIRLEVLKERDATVKGVSIERGGDFNEGSDGVGLTDLGELHEGFGGGVWGDGFEFGDDDFKSIKDQLSLLLSLKEKLIIGSSLFSSVFLISIKSDKCLLVDNDLFLKSSSLGGKFSDGLGRFLDLCGSMAHSGVVVSFLVFAFGHFGGVSFLSISLLLLEVIDHVSDEIGDVLHGSIGFQLESNGIEKIFTEFAFING